MAKKKSTAQKPTARNRQVAADDLTRIEGVGPKISHLLAAAGIDSFSKLSRASVKRLRGILEQAGPRFRMHDPGTWRKQAALAAKGMWQALEELQSHLEGGKEPDDSARQNSAVVAFSALTGGDYVPGQPYRIERLLTPAEVAEEYQARASELNVEFEVARKKSDRLWKRLSSLKEFHPHITGISTRFRTKFGHAVSPLQVVVAVNVARKMTAEELTARGYWDIADCCQGLDVNLKVLEGRFGLLDGRDGFFLRGNALPQQALPFDAEIAGGIPISQPNQISNFGTLGVVTIAGTKSLGLTAQHVVGTDRTVMQIGPPGQQPEARTLGIVPNVFPAPNHVTIQGVKESVDAAEVNPISDLSIRLPPAGDWLRGISHSVDSQPSSSPGAPILYSTRRIDISDKGLTVLKFGNGSGVLVRGGISSPLQTSNIGSHTYYNNFTIQPVPNANVPFAAPGDSGSLIVAQATRINGQRQQAFVAIGILFAALFDSTEGLACNMNSVVKALSLDTRLPPNRFIEDWS